MIHKILLWLLTPILGSDNKPSIRRLMACFFAYEFHVSVQKSTDSTILWAIGTMVGIMLGLTTFQAINEKIKENESK